MIIDINVHYGNWAFRRLGIDNLKKLEKKLRDNGIELAFVSHIGGVLNYQEVDEYNEELKKKIKGNEHFRFVPIVNLNLADAEEKIEKFKFIKIVPNYHFYSINDKKFQNLFRRASDLKIVLFLQLRFEDERNQNPLFKVQGVNIEEIKRFALDFPEIKIIALCAYFNEAIELCKIDNIYSDISFVENYKTIKSLLNYVPPEKVLFGSHTPFTYLEAQIAKLAYSGIGEEEIEKIKFKNILTLMESNGYGNKRA
jgi:predicted TIM-barrel fold metal-dependent hydrolase